MSGCVLRSMLSMWTRFLIAFINILYIEWINKKKRKQQEWCDGLILYDADILVHCEQTSWESKQL